MSKFDVAFDAGQRRVEILNKGQKPSNGFKVIGNFNASVDQKTNEATRGSLNAKTGDHIYIESARKVLVDYGLEYTRDVVFLDRASNEPPMNDYIPTTGEIEAEVRENLAEDPTKVSAKATDHRDDEASRTAPKTTTAPVETIKTNTVDEQPRNEGNAPDGVQDRPATQTETKQILTGDAAKAEPNPSEKKEEKPATAEPKKVEAKAAAPVETKADASKPTPVAAPKAAEEKK